MRTIRRSNVVESAMSYFSATKHELTGVHIYVKSLVFMALVKTLTIWSLPSGLFPFLKTAINSGSIGKIVFLPSVLAGSSEDLYFSVTAIMLVILLFVKPAHITNLIFFLVVLNLFRIKYPVTNGSDYVLLVMAVFAVPLSVKRFSNEYLLVLDTTAFNLFRLLSQIQVALIYLISAWDKLQSDVWRSGDAIDYIIHMETVFNPSWTFMQGSDMASLALAWMTILFELAFVFLIWNERTRLPILCVGVVFHITIWWALSLPDFAWTMIATYLIFLKDRDYSNVLKLSNAGVEGVKGNLKIKKF